VVLYDVLHNKLYDRSTTNRKSTAHPQQVTPRTIEGLQEIHSILTCRDVVEFVVRLVPLSKRFRTNPRSGFWAPESSNQRDWSDWDIDAVTTEWLCVVYTELLPVGRRHVSRSLAVGRACRYTRRPGTGGGTATTVQRRSRPSPRGRISSQPCVDSRQTDPGTGSTRPSRPRWSGG